MYYFKMCIKNALPFLGFLMFYVTKSLFELILWLFFHNNRLKFTVFIPYKYPNLTFSKIYDDSLQMYKSQKTKKKMKVYQSLRAIPYECIPSKGGRGVLY